MLASVVLFVLLTDRRTYIASSTYHDPDNICWDLRHVTHVMTKPVWYISRFVEIQYISVKLLLLCTMAIFFRQAFQILSDHKKIVDLLQQKTKNV